MSKHYKIVHCGIFNEKENGNFFYGLETKNKSWPNTKWTFCL